jgi:hypothetical protein
MNVLGDRMGELNALHHSLECRELLIGYISLVFAYGLHFMCSCFVSYLSAGLYLSFYLYVFLSSLNLALVASGFFL